MAPSTRPAAAVAVVAALLAVGLVPGGTALAAPAGAPAAQPVQPVHPASGAGRADGPRLGAYPERPVARLVVRMADRGPVDAAVAEAAAAAAGVDAASPLRRTSNGAVVVALSEAVAPATAARAARSLEARPDVAWAQPDRWMYPAATYTEPDATAYPQWALFDGADGGYGTRAAAAWTRTGSTLGASDVVVAVIDTGITAHPELAGRTVPGYDFVSLDELPPGVGLNRQSLTANDGGGRDPDPADPGDWVTAAESQDPNFFQTCPAGDSSWHGTHVAGILVAADGGSGVAGVAPDVTVQPIRAIGKCAGYESDIADAIVWASGGSVPGVPANATPADVINLSLGGAGACDAMTQSAIDAARANGSVVVAAAGNAGGSVEFTNGSVSEPNGSAPANCDGVVTVAAIDRTGAPGSANDLRYTNVGLAPGSVDIAAPGGSGGGGLTVDDGVWSTANTGSRRPSSAGYRSYMGTSMAAPHVSAAAALLLSPGVGAPFEVSGTALSDEVERRLLTLVQPFPGADCQAPAKPCGEGILDLSALPPQDVRAEGGAGSVTVSWVATSLDPSAVSTVERSVDGAAFETLGTTTGTTYEDTGAAIGSTVAYRVRTAAGEPSAASNDLLVAADPAPGAPTDVVAGPAGGSSVERFAVAWAAPTTGAAVTGYRVEHRIVGSAGWTCADPCGAIDPSAVSADVLPWPEALPAGRYEVRVVADSALGTGTPSRAARVTARALAQSATLSAEALRASVVDGFQDSVDVRGRSTFASPMRVTVRPKGSATVLRQLETAASTAPTATWNGRRTDGSLVPAGDYALTVQMLGRDGSYATVAALVVKVRTSQVAAPVVSRSSSIVHWYVDGYQDAMTITVPTNVPSTQSWRLTNSTGSYTYRSWTFPRSTRASTSWKGTAGSGARLPTGWYYLRVTAKGPEGTAQTTVVKVGVSSKRLYSERFSRTVFANDVTITPLRGGTPEFRTPGYDSARRELVVRGGYDLATNSGSFDALALSTALPSTVRPYYNVKVATCLRSTSTGGNTLVGGWMSSSSAFAGWYAAVVNGQATVAAGMIDCRTPNLATPAAAVAAGRARWTLFNWAPSSTNAVYVHSFVVTGTRYYLG